MAETSTIFGFMKYVSATDILSDFKKTVDSHFVNSLNHQVPLDDSLPHEALQELAFPQDILLQYQCFLFIMSLQKRSLKI